MSTEDDPPIGRGQPPRSSRWPKGTSGNPRGGRPKRNLEAPYEAIFGHIVEVEQNGLIIKMPADKALVLQFVHEAMKRGGAIGRLALAVLEAHQNRYRANYTVERIVITGGLPGMGELNRALLDHGLAKQMNPGEDTAYMLLEPKLVDAALARLGDRRLSEEEQREVWGSTRNPRKVAWPDWWTQRRGTGRPRPPATSQNDRW